MFFERQHMASLQDALHKAGAVSVKQAREAEAAQVLQMDVVAARSRSAVAKLEKRVGILMESTDPASFRREARKILLERPDIIHEVIQIAHQRGLKEKKEKGGTRLIANLLQLRQALSEVWTDEAKKDIVDKTFSKK